MTSSAPHGLKSTRGWLAAVVALTGAVACLAVASASDAAFGHAGYRSLVGIAVILGSAEGAYLAWRNRTHGERRLSGIVTAGSSLGSALIAWGAAGAGVVAMASGVGLLGIDVALGLFGVYRATGKSSAATLTAMIIVAGLAYFAS